MKQPVVSVVMPVYNGEQFVGQAVESILAQSFKDFEFLIINDGSTDKTPRILDTYAKKDKRIKLLNQNNKGLVASLNRGIKQAKGTYIARQDADDISAPRRLEKQIVFMTNNYGYVAIGSSIEVMDESGKKLHRHALLINDGELKQELMVRSPFAHGSVTFSRDKALEAGLYKKDSWPAEDYDFWLRLSHFGKIANLDEYLYIYREHGQGISQKNLDLQPSKVEEIRRAAWKERSRLLPKQPIDLNFYRSKDMGQLRIERIIDNSIFISRYAWRNHHKSLALGNILKIAQRKITYKKAAGKIKRRIKR